MSERRELEARLAVAEKQRQQLVAAVEAGKRQRLELSTQLGTHRVSIETLQSVKAERAEFQAVAGTLTLTVTLTLTLIPNP